MFKFFQQNFYSTTKLSNLSFKKLMSEISSASFETVLTTLKSKLKPKNLSARLIVKMFSFVEIKSEIYSLSVLATRVPSSTETSEISPQETKSADSPLPQSIVKSFPQICYGWGQFSLIFSFFLSHRQKLP